MLNNFLVMPCLQLVKIVNLPLQNSQRFAEGLKVWAPNKTVCIHARGTLTSALLLHVAHLGLTNNLALLPESFLIRV